MQVCLITALIIKRYKRKNYSFVIFYLMLGQYNRGSPVISTRVVNSPLKTRKEHGLVSRLLFTFWLGGFAGSYFYRLYYLISLKHHKVNIFKRYRVCYFKKIYTEFTKWVESSSFENAHLTLWNLHWLFFIVVGTDTHCHWWTLTVQLTSSSFLDCENK
jgi:hypothetical protein